MSLAYIWLASNGQQDGWSRLHVKDFICQVSALRTWQVAMAGVQIPEHSFTGV